MGEQIRLLHKTLKDQANEVLKNGLKAVSGFDDLGLEMRRDVVYCWLKKEDDKMSSGGQRADYVYVEVTVDEDRCRVAEMDFASIALMYLQGSGGKPKNEEAARLLAELYRVTSVPLSEYAEGAFWTPEVLVKGDIDSDSIRLILDAVTESSLRMEAETIIRELALLEMLTHYGEARFVGSVALDLIVKPDIDIHVLVGTHDLLSVADCIYHYLLAQGHIREVRISDYREQGGVKVGIDAYPGVSGNWSIDIWLTDRVERTGFDLVDRLKRAMRPEHRDAILCIKREYHRHGRLRDGFSTLIYEAVVDQGVRTIEEFHRFLSRRDLRTHTN